jgi:DNA-binding GntR family transcriptional regulator
MDTMFGRIRPTSLSEQAAHMLRRAIMDGNLLPGDRLNERAISQQMGISRIPLREAIQQLEYEGLVLSTPNRGSFVRYFDEEDITDIFTLRAVLEGLACQIIVEKQALKPADFEFLEQSVADQQAAIAAGDFDGWIEAEIQFHTFIVRKAGSERLLKTWQNLHIQSLFATRDTWDAYLRAYGSHPIILDALRCGVSDELIPLHQEVYAKVRQSALELLRTKRHQVESN